MKSKKPYIIGLLACLVVAVGCYVFSVEDKYDERQRQVWNMYLKESKSERNERMIEARDCANRGWAVEVCKEEALAELPLEGMTREELLRIAPGNADACLLLADPYQHILLNNLHSAYYGKRDWFRKAHALKRPGAGFLLEVFDHYESRLPDLPHVNIRSELSKEPDSMDEIRRFPSYGDFRKAMESGDYHLMRALCLIDPHFLMCEEADVLRNVLQKKAGTGDADAAAGLTGLIFEWGYYRNVLEPRVSEEMARPRNFFILWLSQWLPLDKTVKESKTLDRILYLIEKTEEAGDAGNLNAMYVWIKYAPDLIAPYDRNSWERFFRYADRLLECGYAPFVREYLAVESLSAYGPSLLCPALLYLYYSEEDLSSVAQRSRDALLARGDYHSISDALLIVPPELRAHEYDWYGVTHYKGDILGEIQRLEGIVPSFLYDRKVFGLFMEDGVDERVKEYVIKRMKEGALSGNPQAKYFLAQMIVQGYVDDMDRDDAIELLEEAWASCFRLNPFIKSMPMSFKPFCEEVSVSLMHLYVDGKKVEKAFALAAECYRWGNGEGSLVKNSDREPMSCRYYFLGYMYEKGIGTPVDYEKALDCYTIGADGPDNFTIDLNCCRALARMYEYGLGVEKDIAKSLEYYERMQDEPLPESEQGFETAVPEDEAKRLKKLLEEEKGE